MLVTRDGWTWLFMVRLSSTDFMGLPSVSLMVSSSSASVRFFLTLAWACWEMMLIMTVTDQVWVETGWKGGRPDLL